MRMMATPVRCIGLLLVLAAGQVHAGIVVSPFGHTKSGQAVEQVTVDNGRGMSFSSIDYGGIITAITLPDRHGRRSNIVLSLPDVAAYEVSTRRFGGIMGRYAGRIGNARFTLGGKTIELVPNSKGTALHGDPDGYDKRLWQRREFADASSLGVRYRLRSPAGDQNMPGQLDVEVTYRLLRKRNELQIDYQATTDAPTVVNLTNHAYFNLAGAGASQLDTHRFQIHAAHYAQADGKKVPDGVLLPVAGTPLDFQRRRSMTANTAIDDSLVFATANRPLSLVARIDESTSGRTLEIRTTEPAVVFNNGGGFDGSVAGAGGLAYPRFAGFAFETQHLSNSPNQPNFPSTELAPGQTYRSRTSYRFK